MKTIQPDQLVEVGNKKYCRDCARWHLLSEKERELYGIPEYISVGRCTHGKHMSEDNYECIFYPKFLTIEEQQCETCSRETCKENGNGIRNQGCATDWRHQLARARQ